MWPLSVTAHNTRMSELTISHSELNEDTTLNLKTNLSVIPLQSSHFC
jgi:hypothetical protein